jgi:hypothetical protein
LIDLNYRLEEKKNESFLDSQVNMGGSGTQQEEALTRSGKIMSQSILHQKRVPILVYHFNICTYNPTLKGEGLKQLS